MNTNFYRFWFDPIGNRTRVDRYTGRRSIHSTINSMTYFDIFPEQHQSLTRRRTITQTYIIFRPIRPLCSLELNLFNCVLLLILRSPTQSSLMDANAKLPISSMLFFLTFFCFFLTLKSCVTKGKARRKK